MQNPHERLACQLARLRSSVDTYGARANIARMEVETLRTFVEVMQRGSFAAVARERNVDPSSISRTVASLESQLGVRLFQRTTRNLTPTDAALAYFEQVEPLVAQLDQAALIAEDSGDTPRGTLRLTAPVTFAQVNLVPLLPEFAKRYPELSFELLLTDKFLDLVEDRVDLAVRLGRLTESSLIAHRLCDMIYVVAASPDYLRRCGQLKTPAELEQHECLRYPIVGYQSRWRFRAESGVVTEVPVHGRVTASNGVALRQCAVAGMGVLMLPRWNIAAELRAGTLVELFPDYRATASEFDTAAWMLYPSRSYLPLKVRLFADFLKEKFKHGAPAENGLEDKPGARRRRQRV
jgi:DNA-binding transcriptional LysR family regulator